MGKRKEQLENSDSDDSDELEATSVESGSEEENDCSGDDIVNVDFEFFDPKPEDFHGAKALLRSYLDDMEWDLSGMVELFLGQTRVGTVIKTGEDESPIGLISVLNITTHKDLPAMKGVKKFLRKHGKISAEFPKLEALLKSPGNVGLLLSERVLNLPLELCGPLHDGLFDEIQWATEDEPSQALRESFRFEQYLILTRVYQEVTIPSSSKSRKKKKAIGQEGSTNNSLIFIKPEDELLLQLSSWHFTFPVGSESMVAHQSKKMNMLRLVMAVDAKHINSFKSSLQELIKKAGDGDDE